MPEFPGTIPAVKERPKVAKKSTIPVVPPAREGQKAEKKPVVKVPAAVVQKRREAEAAPAQAAQAAPLAPVSTIPPVKERPRVARKSTIAAAKNTGTAMAAKRPLGKTKAPAEEKKPALATNWVNWAPLAAGIVLGFLAPQLHALAAQWEPWGLRIVFPVMQVLGLREMGMSDELTRTLPQLMLYLQFPLEGLLVAVNLRRGMRFAAAFGPIPALHFVCGLVLWIVALGAPKPL